MSVPVTEHLLLPLLLLPIYLPFFLFLSILRVLVSPRPLDLTLRGEVLLSAFLFSFPGFLRGSPWD